ncbi:CPBP family intramembrane glutamic endopeptidase [Nitrosomonas oligotropha]|uniref:CPBP family intramembrane glutamic endopeptidase n=1 Tax=Nitrosomonas oligotropha TaxID=42354 RepID=UPI00136B9CE2|nr:CPBP family intramembrane glutamic endopeptidase [Nitrosomonas oligotropha]MXS82622.1 CPBP family intramembrane metalloprotease [Nitrosomonas oligotropha]
MTAFLTYLREFMAAIDKGWLLFCVIWTGILITLNYTLGIESGMIKGLDSRWYQCAALFLVYCSAFVVPYGFAVLFRSHLITATPLFWCLLLFAPALFAVKASVVNPLENQIGGVWGSYWMIVTTLPFKLLVVLIPLAVLYRLLPAQPGFWGLTLKNVRWQSYGLMLALMIPLIVFAGTQPDFLAAYPRLKQIAFIAPHTDHLLWFQLLYEIGYGIDFVTIELFFRGFLLFAFVRYAGMQAILPMAVFYCSVHFGKPLLECISSFFGGLILGAVAHRTQSIVGGLAVHLGIAWMMEISGCAGNVRNG